MSARVAQLRRRLLRSQLTSLEAVVAGPRVLAEKVTFRMPFPSPIKATGGLLLQGR